MTSSEPGSRLLVSSLLVLLTVTSVFSASLLNIRSASSCNANGKLYTSGQVFTLAACNWFRCNYGKVEQTEEGCQQDGICRPVGKIFEVDCRTFTCNKTAIPGYTSYKTDIIRTRCKDYQGSCHEPGSQFSYLYNGVRYNNCTCTTESKGDVSYTCIR